MCLHIHLNENIRMAMLPLQPQPAGGARARRHSLRIDMTPMVDLGFLLITFFIFTASLMEPTVTRLTMPKADTNVTMDVYAKTLLSVIVDKDKAFVYEDAFDKAAAANSIRQTDYNVHTGLGSLIRQKQKQLDAEGLKDQLMVAIKPLASSSYQNVIDALDEMQLNGVTRYGIIEPSVAEKRIENKPAQK